MKKFLTFFVSTGIKKIRLIPLMALFLCLCLLPSRNLLAVDYESLAEERKNMPIESNSYENWPIGPAIGAQSAILIEANTGAVLYEKNIYEQMYPASITKLLTAYIAVQECELDEMVTFSREAVESINWWEDANMGVNPGAALPLQDVLYGILVGSANEAAYALAEHISGSVEEFAVLMNETARELGCTGSNFVNPNGIHDENHYTTAHDMAIISRAFFSNDFLARIAGTTRFEVPVTETQTREGIILTAKSQLFPGKTYSYDSLIGTKTGYTDAARQTLVSCAAKDGMELICIIFKEEAPAQFTDTVALFDYGFDNFDALNISEVDTTYTIDNFFFSTDNDLFGSSRPILALSNDGYIVLPNTTDFENISSHIVYDAASVNEIASIHYHYRGTFLGRIPLKLAIEEPYVFDFGTQSTPAVVTQTDSREKIIFINVIHLLIAIVIIAVAVSFFLLLFSHKKRGRKIGFKKRSSRRFKSRRDWHIDRY